MKRSADSLGSTAAAWADNDDTTPAAAWTDDADATLKVDVVNGKNRLKKLRKADDETVLDGSVYEKRLREVFEKTTGSKEKPSWAVVDEEGESGDEGGEDGEGRVSRVSAITSTTTRTARLQEKKTHLGAKRDVSDSNRQDRNESDEQKRSVNISKTAGSGGKKVMPSGKIDITRLPNANRAEEQQSVVDCLQFHPNNEVLFTAGRDKTLR